VRLGDRRRGALEIFPALLDVLMARHRAGRQPRGARWHRDERSEAPESKVFAAAWAWAQEQVSAARLVERRPETMPLRVLVRSAAAGTEAAEPMALRQPDEPVT
jgi:hypothetical protein